MLPNSDSKSNKNVYQLEIKQLPPDPGIQGIKENLSKAFDHFGYPDPSKYQGLMTYSDCPQTEVNMHTLLVSDFRQIETNFDLHVHTNASDCPQTGADGTQQISTQLIC